MKHLKKLKPLLLSIALLILFWMPYRLDYYTFEFAIGLTTITGVSAIIWRNDILKNLEMLTDVVSMFLLSTIVLSGIFKLNKEWSPLLVISTLIVFAGVVLTGVGLIKKYRQKV